MSGDAYALLYLGKSRTEPDAGVDSGKIKKLPQRKYKKGIVTGRVSRYTYLNMESERTGGMSIWIYRRFYAQGRTDEIVAYATCAPRDE